MRANMYDWRRISEEERDALMQERRELKRPMHSPAHRISERSTRYHITAACYEHRAMIGTSEKRLADFSAVLVETVEMWLAGERDRLSNGPTSVQAGQAGVPALAGHAAQGEPAEAGTPTDAVLAPTTVLRGTGSSLLAWVVMPNHYHLLVSCGDILGLLHQLGRLHGRLSHRWNGEDGKRGRQIWCKAAETAMKSERHACVTLNDIHHNPVKHGICGKWQEWPYSSATAWLERVGHEEAAAFWAEYPVKEYGRGWDV